MGSRRAAFIAGHIPKTNPTEHETINPSSTAHNGMIDGSVGASCLRARLTTQPANIPIKPPTAVRVIASVRNCQMISLFRAPIADFFCSFGYRHQHDVHHANTTDQQAGSRERKYDDACNCRKLREHLEDRARRADAEVVRFIVGDSATAAHQFGNLVDQLTELIRLCFDIYGDVLDLGVVTLESFKLDEQLSVFDCVPAKQTTGRLLHHANHAIDLSFDVDLTIDRVERSEESLGDS